MTNTTQRIQVHATFVIERSFQAPVSKVWYALSDNAARDQWFGAGAAFEALEKSHDFRVGGHAVERGRWHGGPTSRFESTYTDIVENERIVFTYDMWADDQHMSTSLTTIVLEPEGEGTHLTYTEQAVHLDGIDNPQQREAGTRGLLDNLAAFLDRESKPTAV
jgi:uncharacterized protein YndB with AHSA1/START domain